MTKTNENVTTGESDKVGDKRFALSPDSIESIEEIPSVEDLRACGRTNLQLILAMAENALSTDAETCRGCADNGSRGCFDSCQTAKQAKRALLDRYVENLRGALKMAEELPILPDLRDKNWLSTNIVAYVVCACVDYGKWLVRFEVNGPELVSHMDGDHLIDEVSFDIDLSHFDDPYCTNCSNDSCRNLWREGHTCTFSLRSPYILTADEEGFLSTHPYQLEAWLRACGSISKESEMFDDMRTILACKLEDHGRSFMAPM